MKKHKHILIVVGAGVAAYVAWAIFSKIRSGVTDLASLATAPFTALTGFGSAAYNAGVAVGSDVAAAASLPALGAQSAALDTQIENNDQQDYAPGGRIYNQILATQGEAAANKAWANVQSDLANQSAQTSSWWNFWS